MRDRETRRRRPMMCAAFPPALYYMHAPSLSCLLKRCYSGMTAPFLLLLIPSLLPARSFPSYSSMVVLPPSSPGRSAGRDIGISLPWGSTTTTSGTDCVVRTPCTEYDVYTVRTYHCSRVDAAAERCREMLRTRLTMQDGGQICTAYQYITVHARVQLR